MKCRECGAEIADKALVCYRCGAATTAPTCRPPVERRGGSWLTLVVSAVALALLVMLAIYLGRVPQGTGPSGSISWVIVGVAAVVIILRAIGRRVGRR